MRLMWISTAYVLFGVIAFSWYAYQTENGPRVEIVKVKQVPPLVPRPTEVRR